MFLTRYPFLLVRTASLVVWALAAFSAVAWGLRLTRGDLDVANPLAAPMSAATDIQTAATDIQTAARSLGALPAAAVAAPTLASRFQLLGVLSGGASQGAALIAVDGKPARPYRVGRVVVDDLVLQSAQGRRASLGATVQGPTTLTLELPAKK